MHRGSERLIKVSWAECHTCERETPRKTEGRRERERNKEAYLWLRPETAVSLRCVEDGSSLISSPSCHSIYVAGLLSSEGQTCLFPGGRRKENQFDFTINHRGEECRFVKERSHVLFYFILQKDPSQKQGVFFRMMKRLQTGSCSNTEQFDIEPNVFPRATFPC